MIKLDLNDIKGMMVDLEAFRSAWSDRTPLVRLGGLPFRFCLTLFEKKGVFSLPDKVRGTSPCTRFGKHLVFKIVDELLDSELIRSERLEEKEPQNEM